MKIYESINTGRRLRSTTKPKNVAEEKDNVVKNKKVKDVKNELDLKQGTEESVNEEALTEKKFPEKNPLENPLIISTVFELLNLEEIKQCRLVCTKWNDISISFVEKMCQITIGPSANVIYAETRSPETFNELIENSGIIFRNFKLTSRQIPSGRWSIPSLVRFFDDEKENLSKLTIENIKVWVPSVRDPDNRFSMDPYIGNNLTQLTIDNSKFTVSSDKLMTVKSLSFRNCMVRFVDNCRLRPEKIEMKDIQAMNNGQLIEVLNLDNHFKLDNLRELILQCTTPNRRQVVTKVSINLKACDGILDNLMLENVIVENLAECKWEIKGKVKLEGIPFERKSLMQFTELHFGKANLNLEALPDSIEKLTLEKTDGNMDITCPPYFSLPNLKYLQFFGDRRNPEGAEILSLFTDCQNLKTVKFANVLNGWMWHRTVQMLKTEWISRSVECLFLDGSIKAVGNKIHLKRLVIQNNNHAISLGETLRLLKSDHLVIRLHHNFHSRLETTRISLTLIGLPYETLAIGPCDNYVIDKGHFFDRVDVDKQSRYYIFANRKGKAITETEFNDLVEQ